jgi:cobalamin-dependent methionine synthase I
MEDRVAKLERSVASMQEAMIGLSRRIEAKRWINQALVYSIEESAGINVDDIIADLQKLQAAFQQRNEATELIAEVRRLVEALSQSRSARGS